MSKKKFLILALAFIFLCSFYIFARIWKGNKPVLVNSEKSLKALLDSMNLGNKDFYLMIDKSDYRLSVMKDSAVLKTYKVVFGFNPVNDKLKEGDGCTPEGWFTIQSKYPHKSWNKFMWISYPTADSWKKHNAAKEKKEIPVNAGIGGQVGIHGVPKGTDSMIALKHNWTLGCISLTNDDINDLYSCCSNSTKVHIRK